MAWVKQFARGIATFAGLFLCLRYWGDFSNNQGAVLAMILVIGVGVGGDLYESLKAAGRSREHFSPYSVLVVPQLQYLLLDYKLIKDAEEFRQRWEKGLKDVFSIYFTVVGAQRDIDLPGLVYWDNRKSFVTQVDFEEPVKTLKLEQPVTILAGLEEALGLPPREVTLFLREAGGGYELGLTAPTAWWKRLRGWRRRHDAFCRDVCDPQ